MGLGIPDDDNLINDESEDEAPEQDADESGEENEESNEENEEESKDDNEADEDHEERSSKETEGEEDEEDEGEEDEEADEGLEEEEEEDEVITEDQAIAAAKEKYPNLFKEFPDLRKYVYLGRQLSNIYPSVESAEEAADKAEMMDGIAFNLAEGNCVPLLNSLEAASEDGAQLQLFASRILGALHKKDKALFARATMPVLANAARLLHRLGVQNKNKNAVVAAQIFAKVFFPDGNMPDGKLVADEQNPEAESLKKQLIARDQKEHDNFNSSVQEDTNKIIKAEILESLKSKKLTEMQKETLVEKIIGHTKELLKKNPQHMRKMILIQRQAFKNGHTPAIARKLQNEWLASARPLLKVVQARMTAKFLGEGGVDKDKKKKVKKPLSSGGTGGKGDDKNKQTKDGKAPAPDWAAMRKAGISDADYLLGKEIAKK